MPALLHLLIHHLVKHAKVHCAHVIGAECIANLSEKPETMYSVTQISLPDRIRQTFAQSPGPVIRLLQRVAAQNLLEKQPEVLQWQLLQLSPDI